MDQSLSIIIAAHNAQNHLAQQVYDLLELATDLTPDFELMIVDDGSEDATEEVAYELTREFPQVRLVRHHESLGVSAAVRSGMCGTTGDVVLVLEGALPVSVSEIRRLWALRGDEEVLIVHGRRMNHPKPLDPSLLRRLMAWGAKVRQTVEEQQRTGLQMIRRRAAEQAAEQLQFELDRIEPPSSVAIAKRPNFMDRSRQLS